VLEGVALVTPSNVMAAGAAVPKYVTVTGEPLAPDDGVAAIMFPEVVIVTIVETELVPSLMVIEYWPADVGALAMSEANDATPLASVEILRVVVEYEPVTTFQVADGVFHAAGMPGEAVIVSSALALKPVIVANTCVEGVFDGAKVVVEFTPLAPRASVTSGVTVNVAVPTLPRLSTTVTVRAPATPACDMSLPAGVAKRNAAVPCSVTVAGVYVAALAEALLPTVTETIVAVGPKPDRVAVTAVPTGPELGDKVTVGVVSDSVVVATLFHVSVKLKIGPIVELIASRLTVAVYVPRYVPYKSVVILLLLKVVGLLVVTVLAVVGTVIVFPEKFADLIWYENADSIKAVDVGNPEAEIVTDVPAAIDAGVIVTVGFVIVNVPATTEWPASETSTVCAPGDRL
jgi:hypothetical protein